MVDPSVHRFRLSLSGRDESSGGSDFGPARENSASSVYEGTAHRQLHKSRSRTRRPSVNRDTRTSSAQKDRAPKNSIPIEESSKGESSSASSSPLRASSSYQSRASTSSSSSKQSSSDHESMQSSPVFHGKSFPEEHSATSGSEDEAIQASTKPTSRGKSFPDNDSATSVSGDECMKSSTKPKSRGKPFPDNHSATSGSEDESVQSSKRSTSRGKTFPGNHSATSRGKSFPDNESASSGSEDESMQSSKISTSKGMSILDSNTATSSLMDESMQSTTKPTSKGKIFPDNHIVTLSSEDESMESSPGPTSNGKSFPDNDSATSCSEDEPRQTLTKSNSREKSFSDNDSATSGSDDESMKSSKRPTSRGKSILDSHSTTASLMDESMQLANKPASRGKIFPDIHSATSSSEDESMQSSPGPASIGKSFPDNDSATPGSEDESMQSSPKPNCRRKLFPDNDSSTSDSEDESMQSSAKPVSAEKFIPDTGPETETLELEEISTTPISEESPYVPFGNDGVNARPEKYTELIDDQLRKELGDKLTVKFKVNLPEVGNRLIGGPLQFLRVPQFIPVESGAFDTQTFKDCMTPDDLKDEQARGEFVSRLKTTVRWRENQDKVKESNARIVRWSDGTETFHVGAEVFDVMHHKVIDDKNQLYVRLESCYQAQGSITDKMTLRPKLDSTFGQSHVQGLRNRAMNKPQTGVVKVLSDMITNPMTDREQRVKADLANLRKEERLKRREIQMSLRKPRVKPMRHCTADDSDPEQPTGEQEDKIGRNNTPGIRTNRNMAVNPGKAVSTDEEDDEDAYDSDVNDIINDDELDYYEDGVDEALSDEPRATVSKPKRDLRHSSKSDSDEGPKTRTVKRKTKQLVYSDSSSD